MFATVDIPDEAAGARVREGLAASVRGRSLGRLGDIAAWVASVTASSTPEPFDRARAIVIALSLIHI